MRRRQPLSHGLAGGIVCCVVHEHSPPKAQVFHVCVQRGHEKYNAPHSPGPPHPTACGDSNETTKEHAHARASPLPPDGRAGAALPLRQPGGRAAGAERFDSRTTPSHQLVAPLLSRLQHADAAASGAPTRGVGVQEGC